MELCFSYQILYYRNTLCSIDVVSTRSNFLIPEHETAITATISNARVKIFFILLMFFWFYGIEYCTWQNLSIPPNNSLFDCDTNSLRCAHRGIRQSRVAGCRVRPPPYGAVVPYCYATELSAQLYNRDDSTGKATKFKNSIKHDKRTPRYTTNLKEIIKVK